MENVPTYCRPAKYKWLTLMLYFFKKHCFVVQVKKEKYSTLFETHFYNVNQVFFLPFPPKKLSLYFLALSYVTFFQNITFFPFWLTESGFHHYLNGVFFITSQQTGACTKPAAAICDFHNRCCMSKELPWLRRFMCNCPNHNTSACLLSKKLFFQLTVLFVWIFLTCIWYLR